MMSRPAFLPSAPTLVAMLGLALSLLSISPAAAQGADDTPAPADGAAWGGLFDVQSEQTPSLKSPTKAFWWSFLGTAIPSAAGAAVPGIALAGGVLLGPSLGHFYAGRPGRALAGIGTRLAIGAGIVLLAAPYLEDSHNHDNEGWAVVAFSLLGADMVWDICRAPHSARVHNDQLLREHPTVGVIPSVGPDGVGLRVTMSF